MKLGLALASLLVCADARAADYALPDPPATSTGAAQLTFTADRLDYQQEDGIIHLQGKVLIKESTWTIKADDLYLDTRRQQARSRGFLLVEDGQSAVFGDFGDFDFKNHSGVLYHTDAGHADWRIHAKKVELLPDRRLRYDGARFTSCSLDPKPHYHFRASRVRVTPKKHILATNAVFFLGRVPVFYFPVLWKPLRPISFLRMKVQPGYDRRNGGSLRGTVTTAHGPHAYSKLYLDYYTSQGFGGGGELERRKGDDRGVLYAYRIKEISTKAERWAFVGNAYQGLSSSAAFQGRFEVQSDSDFNNDYARARVFRVQPQLINNAAVSYRWTSATARVAYNRLDAATEGPTRYVKQAESAPRVEFQTSPLRVWKLPWLNTFSGLADNNYEVGRPFIQKSAGAGWEGTRTVPLIKGLASWVPTVGYRQTFYDRIDQLADDPVTVFSTTSYRDVFVGRWLADNTVRLATRAGDWDATHRIERRQRPDTLRDDAGAPDRGFETHLVRLTNGFRPTTRVLARVTGAYDLRQRRDVRLGYRERVQPVVGELNYTPRSTLFLSLRDEYRPHSGNRAFIGSALWGDEQSTFVSGSVGYNVEHNSRYLSDVQFGWASSTSSWRLAAGLRSEAFTRGGIDRLSGFRLFEKEVSVAREWHDFFTSVLVRFRPKGVKEIRARVDIKLGRVEAKDAPRRDWEAEWFPERRTGLEDRP